MVRRVFRRMEGLAPYAPSLLGDRRCRAEVLIVATVEQDHLVEVFEMPKTAQSDEDVPVFGSRQRLVERADRVVGRTTGEYKSGGEKNVAIDEHVEVRWFSRAQRQEASPAEGEPAAPR